jgi:hypothetical protein
MGMKASSTAPYFPNREYRSSRWVDQLRLPTYNLVDMVAVLEQEPGTEAVQEALGNRNRKLQPGLWVEGTAGRRAVRA